MSIAKRIKLIDSLEVLLVEATYHKNNNEDEDIPDRRVIWNERDYTDDGKRKDG